MKITNAMLITTKGCDACRIQTNILKAVCNARNIELEVCDFQDAPEWVKTDVNCTDFPVSVFFHEELIAYHFSGTKAIDEIESIVDDIENPVIE